MCNSPRPGVQALLGELLLRWGEVDGQPRDSAGGDRGQDQGAHRYACTLIIDTEYVGHKCSFDEVCSLGRCLVSAKRTTPLLEYIKNKKLEKQVGEKQRRTTNKMFVFLFEIWQLILSFSQRIREEKREERRRRELEKKRQREEEKRKRREEERRKRREVEKQKKLSEKEVKIKVTSLTLYLFLILFIKKNNNLTFPFMCSCFSSWKKVTGMTMWTLTVWRTKATSLKLTGANGRNLLDRWSRWNQRKGKDCGQMLDFISQTLLLGFRRVAVRKRYD